MHKPLLEEYIKAWELYERSNSPLDLDYVRHLHYKMEKEIDEEYEAHSSDLKIAKNLVRALRHKFAESSEAPIPSVQMMQLLRNKPNEWTVVERGKLHTPQKVKDNQDRIWSLSRWSGNFELDS